MERTRYVAFDEVRQKLDFFKEVLLSTSKKDIVPPKTVTLLKRRQMRRITKDNR